jgi:ribosomal protein L40E
MRKNHVQERCKIVCIKCGATIRENARHDSFGQCLKCFYHSLTSRLPTQKRAIAGEFVSDR